MSRMMVSRISLCFDSQKHTQELSVTLPENSRIMSVHARKNKLWVRFAYKTSGIILYNKYLFHIYKYENNNDTETLKNQYIKFIHVENNTYAVVCKKSS